MNEEKKVFDVLVFSDNAGTDVVYKRGLIKRDAKKLVKDLKSKGKKAHFVSSRNEVDAEPEIIQEEIEQEREAQAEQSEIPVSAHDKHTPSYERYRDKWPEKTFSKNSSEEDE